MRDFQIVSDITYILVLSPKLDPSMTKQMEEKFTEILHGEMTLANIHLSNVTFSENHHLFKLAAPPEVSPMMAADIVMGKVTPRFLSFFEELEGWGSIYHDKVFIKSGEEISDQQLDDLLSISLGDI